ncbi:Uncharacterized protein dnm_064310 [Desulfonema magnum]|uniref:Uncharacterized protein n=1 Tax=Desulfonema magnum TaxID=45655 RepID=A0A975BSR8_9BACT|nr:Uncharacterized protein dnm_064310 [Desulfonema magnum]
MKEYADYNGFRRGSDFKRLTQPSFFWREPDEHSRKTGVSEGTDVPNF